jgi:NADH dehydrogenase FAD-containing subunit
LTSGIRGFLHHFYPAYDAPLVQYAQKVSEESDVQTLQERRVRSIEATTVVTDEQGNDKEDSKQTSWGQAERWLKNVAESAR